MPLATFADAPSIPMDGFTFRPLAVPSRGSTELAIWAVQAAPGASGQTHTVDREEVFVVTRGRMVGTVDGEPVQMRHGDALIVPPDTPFAIANPGDEIAELTVCTSKGVTATLNGQVIAPPWAQ